jgi:hypothetical protein
MPGRKNGYRHFSDEIMKCASVFLPDRLSTARLRMLRSWHPHNPHGAGATSPGVRIIKFKTGSSSFSTVNDDRRNSTSLPEATLHFNLQAIKLPFVAFAA